MKDESIYIKCKNDLTSILNHNINQFHIGLDKIKLKSISSMGKSSFVQLLELKEEKKLKHFPLYSV